MTVCSVPSGGSGGGDGGSGGPTLETVSAEEPDGDSGTWTILIHFAIDNNIDYSFEENYGIVTNYLNTLESVEAADTSNRVKILVLMDGYKSLNFTDGYYRLTGGSFSSDRVLPIDGGISGEVNSGDTATTEAFMDWVVTNYPSDHYMYSVFNHGSGFDDKTTSGTYSTYAIGLDNTNFDCLTHYELGVVTAYLKGKIGKNIDLFYPYACLMGGVELAYEIRSSVNYLLFSEQTFPADYWSYEALNAILSSTKTSGKGIGKAFCSSAYNYFTFTASRNFTLSLIDISHIGDLRDDINTYATSALAQIGSTAAIAAYYNTAASNSFKMDSSYYIDLGDYLKNVIASSNISSTAKTNAGSVQTEISNSVIYQRQRGYPNATGITIFHNIWGSAYYFDPATYQTVLTFDDTSWDEYMITLSNLDTSTITPDSYEADNSQTQATLITVDGAIQSHNLHATDDMDLVKVVLSTTGIYTFDTYADGVLTTTDTMLRLYDSNLSLITYNDDISFPSNLYSKIIYNCTTAGTYYLLVHTFSNSNAGYYVIRARSGSH